MPIRVKCKTSVTHLATTYQLLPAFDDKPGRGRARRRASHRAASVAAHSRIPPGGWRAA
jgi:hypothetical protein